MTALYRIVCSSLCWEDFHLKRTNSELNLKQKAQEKLIRRPECASASNKAFSGVICKMTAGLCVRLYMSNAEKQPIVIKGGKNNNPCLEPRMCSCTYGRESAVANRLIAALHSLSSYFEQVSRHLRNKAGPASALYSSCTFKARVKHFGPVRTSIVATWRDANGFIVKP